MSKEIHTLADLTPDNRNANAGTPRGRGLVETSLQKYGAGRSVLVDRNGKLVAGNKTAEPAAAIGLDDVVVVQTNGRQLVVVQRTDLDLDEDTAARELAIADNRSGELGLSWDTDVLAELGQEIDLSTFWTKDEIAALLLDTQEPGGGGDDFDVTPDDGPTRVQPGELWQLGRHRLLCGDSTDAAAVESLMVGERATLLATDPPYNVGIVYGDETDDSKIDAEYERFTRGWMDAWQAVSDRQVISPGCNNLVKWCRWFDPYHIAPWTKTNAMTNGKVSRWWCWEPVLFFGAKWKRERPNDVFDFPVPPQTAVGIGSLSGLHPCPKPVPMWIELIECYSERDDIVADAFAGSGTMLIAAERTHRKAYVMELEPKYADLCLRRWEAETGLTAERIE